MKQSSSKVLYLFICIFMTCSLFAVNVENKEKSIRLGLIGANQIGLGLNLGFWTNSHVSMRLMYQLGSYRNLMNMYVGTGYSIRIPCGENREAYMTHHLPLFVGAKLNYYSWQRNSLYIGVETEYDCYVGTTPVSQNYWALSGNIGFRLQACDIHICYSYDFVPAYKQKYIYESPEYNYTTAYRVIYERMYIGLGMSYFFTLGL